MVFLKKWLFILLLTVVFLVVLLAAVDNSTEVPLSFMGYETPAWPVFWWVLLAFGLGVLCGNLLSLISGSITDLRRRIAARRDARPVKTSPGRSGAPANPADG